MKKRSRPKLPKRYVERVREWERNAAYYDAHRREILRDYKGKFVAVWNSQVIDSDSNKLVLTKRVQERIGKQPAFFTEVTAKPKVYRFPSISLLHRGLP
jgi:hypothetical protein